MEYIYKNLTLIQAQKLIDEIKDNKEYSILVSRLEYFTKLQEEKITNEELNELNELMSRIKRLLELDKKVKEKEENVNLFEEISNYFKEQEIRQEDLGKIVNGEIFKIIEEIDTIAGKVEKDHDLIFITRKGANEYKQEHKDEFRGKLKIKVIDNKDKLLEKILRIIENNY